MGQKIGFVSFIPDGGHVLPLIRIAAAFLANGYDVNCYFPEESLKYIAGYDIPVKSLGKVTTGIDKKIFAKLSKRSVFYNGFTNFTDLEKGYMQPIKETIAGRMEDIKELITRENLSLMIVDNNVFNGLYRLLAVTAKISLVIHLSEGNCRHLQRPYVFTYGVSKHTTLTQKTIEIVGFFFGQLYFWPLILRDGRFNYRIANLLQKPFPGINPEQVSPIHITTGIAFIEKEKISGLQKPKDDLFLFPPISRGGTWQLTPALQKWFDDGKKPVVYICFGTMVQGNKRLFAKVIKGLKDLEINILWSASHEQRLILEEIGVLPNMRIEEFVPQPEVLAMKQVRCFVTHGGAGSVQESLLSGKPLLCIPFMFDQPYNSSIVAALGAGIRLWKNRVSSRSIKSAVSQLLYHPAYTDAAQNIQKQMREIDGEEAIIRHFRKTGILPEKSG